jgi:broad specificity phosphatase PhoE
MGPFVLVRHAKPHRDSSVPPAEWDLDPTGIGAIAELAQALRDLGLERTLTRSEPKAVQTGRVLADLFSVLTEQDARLNEVRRPEVSSDADFIRTAKTNLTGGTVASWES